MKTATEFDDIQRRDGIPTTEEGWKALSVALIAHIQRCIQTLNIFHWQGGEYLVAEDVLTETYLRAISYAREAELGTIPPIKSFESFCKTIAKRYLLDLRRKDKRLTLSIDNEWTFNASEGSFMSPDPAEIVEEDDYLYARMLKVAQSIKKFPTKQRIAILIHLANQTDFDDEHPSALERAMFTVGIPLRIYRRALPSDPALRSRHAALIALAYKRLREDFAYERLDDAEFPQQIQPTTSIIEQGTASDTRKKTMDTAPEENRNTVIPEELSCIDRLHEPYRQAVQLHYIEKWSYPTIADHLKLPVGTVKSHVSRGLKLLHSLAQQDEIPTNVKNEQKKQVVLANLHKLSGQCKRAVQLHCLEDWSYPEVAAELQVPLNTAKSYVHRGMKLLCA